MTVDRLWYLADEADQQAAQTYHDLEAAHTEYQEFSKTRWISRPRFRTIADRVTDNGLPYGAHTLVSRPSGEILLVRHTAVDKWVLPGGEVAHDETFQQAARRELSEEAGINARFGGLALLGRVEFYSDDHSMWGVLPIYEARAETTDLTVADPDEEITDAQWFETLPEDTRDRDLLLSWIDENLE